MAGGDPVGIASVAYAPAMTRNMFKINNTTIEENVSLAKYSSFDLGGPARFFVSVKKIEDLENAYRWVAEQGLPVFILGGGSNLLFSDEGFPGLVAKIDLTNLEIKPPADLASGEPTLLYVEAGVGMIPLASKISKMGLTGLEWANGVPGTLGGAVRGNAGAFRHDIGEMTKWVEIWRKDRVVRLNQAECGFKYRDSFFKNKFAGDIILGAELAVRPGDLKAIQANYTKYLKHRHSTQPKKPSAGCVFKNHLLTTPEEIERLRALGLPEEFIGYKKAPAAWLIEQCGLKGAKSGGAMISFEHANFIINADGSAKASDVMKLLRLIKEKVYEKFKIKLDEEVQLVGFNI